MLWLVTLVNIGPNGLVGNTDPKELIGCTSRGARLAVELDTSLLDFFMD